jgi:hypothetical protein
MATHATAARVLALLVPTAIISCSNSFDTSRTLPPRGTLGAELFGVMCDRVGAQSLHEDLTGASYYSICHAPFTDTVDTSQLPAPAAGQVNTAGQPVPLAQVEADRAYGIARIQTLAQHRTDLIAALDATFPDVMIPVKDITNPDPTQSCNPPGGSGASGEGRLHDALTDLLGRFQGLYNDGTIPQSTESIAAVVNAFKADPDAQAAWAVFDARAGYRPVDINLGAMRPTIAYPQLRDFANATLALLSADSQPYAENPQLDASGNRIPVPGPAYPQLSKLLGAAHAELLNTTADPAVPPLVVSTDPITGRQILSRPRQDMELLQSILYAQNAAFGGGTSRYIVQRDSRGYVSVPLVNGQVPAPFQDSNGDGLPDVDAQGNFITTGGPAPSPFFAVGATDAPARDTSGRALTGAAGQLIYGYVDTSHTYTASLVRNLEPLFDPNPADDHETLMNFLAGGEVLFGARQPNQTKSYADGETVTYDAYDTQNSPLLDLIYAFGQILADPTAGDTFSFAKTLVTQQPNTVARLVGDSLYAKGLANADTSGRLPKTSTLWDEMIDTTIQIEQEPGLLEDVLRALGDDASLPLSTVFSTYMANDDHISYDRTHLNGPTFNETTMDGSQPKTPVDRTGVDAAWNRSEMQRFLQAIHDTNGVTACNKAGAVVHALNVNIPIVGNTNVDIPTGPANSGLVGDVMGAILAANYGSQKSFTECEVFKIDNLAAFYLDSIVGDANLYFRDNFIRNGSIGGLGAATVGLIENSSYIGYDPGSADAYNDADPTKPGFWDTSGSQTFRPKPAWLDRLVFFDQVNDSPSPGQTNYNTNHFLTDLQGMQLGAAACPERLIPDPCVTSSTCKGAPDIAADGMVHGLRSCPTNEWLFNRDQDSTFVWEDLGFYNAITPLVTAFATAKNPVTGQPRHREDLFISLMEVLHRHWQTQQGAAANPDECVLTYAGPNGTPAATNCSQDGAGSYEPLMAQIFSSDMLTALHDTVKTIEGISVPTCATADPVTGVCTKAGTPLDGVSILANATRALIDPAQAKAVGLQDRQGHATSLRNDGTTNPQVTPLYLVLETLDEIDQAFANYAQQNPTDTQRQADWRLARSQLVDQFLGVTGQNTTTQTFTDPSLPAILPVLLDAVRTQVAAHCPGPPYGTCAWARQQLTQNAAATIGGPTFATALDVAEALRQNDRGRQSLEQLLTYLVDAGSNNDALAEFLASMDDLVQVIRDDANLVPLYHVLATAALPTTKDASGNTHRGVVDATTALLSRISGRAYQGATEICASELDPDGVMPIALANLVTPMTNPDATVTQTPLEFILDAIGDVNKQSPGSPGPVKAPDLGNTANELSEFLLDPERGLEQFYAIVRNGTED